MSEAQKVAHLKLRMEKTAFAWANTLPTASTASLEAFKGAIRARFISEADRQRARKQFFEAKQGEHEKVIDFYMRIRHLAGRIDNITEDVI